MVISNYAYNPFNKAKGRNAILNMHLCKTSSGYGVHVICNCVTLTTTKYQVLVTKINVVNFFIAE